MWYFILVLLLKHNLCIGNIIIFIISVFQLIKKVTDNEYPPPTLFELYKRPLNELAINLVSQGLGTLESNNSTRG